MTIENQVQKSELVSVTPIACKDCGSTDIVRFGTLKGIQRYWCKTCKRKFVNNNALPAMRIPKDQIALAVSEYFNGSSINAIRRNLKQQYNVEPSQSTVHEWIMNFAKEATTEANLVKVKVGDVWVADETVIHKNWGGRKRRLWLIDIIDRDTRFLLATKLSRNRSTGDIKKMMELARDRAGKTPKEVWTDGWKGYQDGLELAYGADAKHIITTPFGNKDDSSTLIERWHGTLKDRTKVMRGLKKLDTAEIILDGWLCHYNFFRNHESLDNQTPAQAAKADFKYRDWKDVINGQETPKPHIVVNNPQVVRMPEVSKVGRFQYRVSPKVKLPKTNIGKLRRTIRKPRVKDLGAGIIRSRGRQHLRLS